VRVQVVLDQADLLGLGVMHFQKLPHTTGVIRW
jgi:hypothetical protein